MSLEGGRPGTVTVLNLLSLVAIVSVSYAEALEYSGQSSQ